MSEFPKITKVYARRDKDANYDTAHKLGLSDEATDMFRFCLMELEVTIEVNEDGTYKIISVKE